MSLTPTHPFRAWCLCVPCSDERKRVKDTKARKWRGGQGAANVGFTRDGRPRTAFQMLGLEHEGQALFVSRTGATYEHTASGARVRVGTAAPTSKTQLAIYHDLEPRGKAERKQFKRERRQLREQKARLATQEASCPK